MESMHYVGLDIHKKIIAFCIKTLTGRIIGQGTIPATRKSLDEWVEKLPQPWSAAITAAKKKNDRADAEKIADLLRVNMLPECYMAVPRKNSSEPDSDKK